MEKLRATFAKCQSSFLATLILVPSKTINNELLYQMNYEMIFKVFERDHILSFVRETEIQQQLVDVFYTKDDTPQSSHYNT